MTRRAELTLFAHTSYIFLQVETARRQGVVQVESERTRPNQVVRKTQDRGCNRPLTAPDKIQQTDRSQNLAQKPDRRQKPPTLGNSCDLQVDDAVQADDHTQAGEDFRIVLQGHTCVAEQPLRVEN